MTNWQLCMALFLLFQGIAHTWVLGNVMDRIKRLERRDEAWLTTKSTK